MSNDCIDLARGWPSQSLLPTQMLAQATSRVLANPKLYTPALLYGPDPGYQPLRQAIADWLSVSPASAWTSADNVCITGGASQNIACLLQVFSDPSYTRHVYMVAPTYHLACRIFADNGFAGRLKAVPQDDEGLDVAYLEACLLHSSIQSTTMSSQPIKQPNSSQKLYRNIIYCVPTFSNPCGRILSLRRRQELVRLARQYDALIIADDVYDYLSWSSTPLPPKLVDIDQALDGGPTSAWGNVVSNGSFSKILGPGLRTGWTVGARTLIEGLSQCGSNVSGGAPSQFMAVVIAEALGEGAVQRYIAEYLIPTYQDRCRAALEAIERYLVPCGVTVDTEAEGGYFIYLHLPESLQTIDLVEAGEQLANVLVENGAHFRVVGDELVGQCGDSIRICFAWEAKSRIVEGIRRLGYVLSTNNAKSERSQILRQDSKLNQTARILCPL